MANQFRATLFMVLILLYTQHTPSIAQTIDPHKVYEQKCAACHEPHGHDFVHNNLIISDGKLVGRRSNRDIRKFLERGHGDLTEGEVDALIGFLLQIRKSGGLFHKKCLTCHDRAVKLARLQLTIKDDKLVGRYSKIDIEQFLQTHGRLEPAEVSEMIATLKRQLMTR